MWTWIRIIVTACLGCVLDKLVHNDRYNFMENNQTAIHFLKYLKTTSLPPPISPLEGLLCRYHVVVRYERHVWLSVQSSK